MAASHPMCIRDSAGAMLCGMLTACGGANGSSSAPSASSEGQAEPAAPETEKEKVVLWHLWTGVEAGYLSLIHLYEEREKYVSRIQFYRQ